MATHEQLSDPSKKWTVYIHAFPNGKKYVGITSQTTEERWGSRGQGYTERCRKIHAAINKYGWENVHHEIVKESLTKAEAEELEQKLIELYRTTEDDYGYNIEKGGLCFSGATSETRENLKISKRKRPHVVSEEYKKQLSEWYSGVKNPFYGKKHTAESIEKMSEAHRGKIPSEETRKKRSQTAKQYYVDHPEKREQRRQMAHIICRTEEYRESRREYCQRFGRKVMCVETGEVFSSIKRAGREMGIDGTSITHCLNNPNKYKTAGSYHWVLCEGGDS